MGDPGLHFSAQGSIASTGTRETKKAGSRESEGEKKMSKKNNLAKRKKQHEFDLQREKVEKEKREKKLQAKKSRMKIDVSDMKRKKKSSGMFQIGKKKVKTRLSALAKVKAAQAMEIDKQS